MSLFSSRHDITKSCSFIEHPPFWAVNQVHYRCATVHNMVAAGRSQHVSRFDNQAIFARAWMHVLKVIFARARTHTCVHAHINTCIRAGMYTDPETHFSLHGAATMQWYLQLRHTGSDRPTAQYHKHVYTAYSDTCINLYTYIYGMGESA